MKVQHRFANLHSVTFAQPEGESEVTRIHVRYDGCSRTILLWCQLPGKGGPQTGQWQGRICGVILRGSWTRHMTAQLGTEYLMDYARMIQCANNLDCSQKPLGWNFISAPQKALSGMAHTDFSHGKLLHCFVPPPISPSFSLNNMSPLSLKGP